MPSRRSTLALLGASVTAGCTGVVPGLDDGGFRLGRLWVLNTHSDPEPLALTLDRGDETLFDDVVRLDATDSSELAPVWSTAPATYTLTFGPPEGKRASYELTGADDESTDGGCTFVTVRNRPSRDVWGHLLHSTRDHPWNPTCPE